MTTPRAIRKVFLAIEQNEGAGARVRRSIGGPQLRELSPFLMLDHFSSTSLAGFPDHPHRGQETITYLLNGELDHEDFTGNKGTIKTGGLQFMTAGRGIMHSEMPRPNADGSPNIGLQLWVDLPQSLKKCEPRYRDLQAPEIPNIDIDDKKVHIKIISGKSHGVDSVKELAYTPVWILDIEIKPGGKITQDLPSGWNAFAYTLTGTTTFTVGDDKRVVGQYHNVVFEQKGDTVSAAVEASAKENGHFLLIAGLPLDQTVVRYGPFVMNTEEEIQQAMMDFRTCSNGFERARGWESIIGGTSTLFCEVVISFYLKSAGSTRANNAAKENAKGDPELQKLRRKARCVFRPEFPSSCVDCFERRIPCQDQNSNETQNLQSDNVTPLSERVAHLEALVQSLSTGNIASLSNPGHPAMDDSTSLLADKSTSLFGLSVGSHNNATILGLFDNSILKREPSTDGKILKSINSKDSQVCRELLSSLPSPDDLKQILEIAGGWFRGWEHLFSEIQPDKSCNTLEDFVTSGFEQQNPVRVAMGLLCLAISLQSGAKFNLQLYNYNLPLPPMDLSNHYLNLVDHFVISDDDYSGSIAFVDLIAMHAKCLVNLCKISKSWSYFRRAISNAQLLGLHQNQNIGIEEQDASSQRRKDGWWSLNILDRYTSLLLGLPYAATLELHEVDINDIDPRSDVCTVLYHRQLAVIAGIVIDRNQKPNPSLSSTIEIERKLDEVASMLPESWWNDEALTPRSQLDAEIFYKRLMSRHWASQIRIFLHLPFAFKSYTESQFEYNRLACFDAVRKASRLYQILREDREAAFHMCNILDFSGFLAALILLLGRTQKGPTFLAPDLDLEKADKFSVEATCEILRKAALEPGCAVAVQGLQVLETLKSSTIYNDKLVKESKPWEGTLTVPYFGRIKISTRKSQQSRQQRSFEEQPNSLPGTAQKTLFGTNQQEPDLFLSQTADVGDLLDFPDSFVEFPQMDIDWQQMPNIGDLDQDWSFFAD
ncbi:hypothetical protein G7Y89_g6919 [Cudoniella acicularis]|uniref:Xylanolytic transcriptional activator regulatory domain-containing protein n=1 Tax=Cudoniella acicularis TaxID=354080 RepID=A0A8H4RLC9_9HELO|nr:hypothetical protein G7Y89_g6919 [Cudoniella acicularis]